MSTLKKRTRLAAVATATLTGASIFALAAPASATPPNDVNPATAVAAGGNRQITVSWKAPVGGDPATFYTVLVYNYDENAVPGPVIGGYQRDYFGAPTAYHATTSGLSTTITDVPAGDYKVLIVAQNDDGDGDGVVPASPAANNGKITVTDPANQSPVKAAVPVYDYFRPFSSVEDMLANEYKLWTGFNKKGAEITNGRGPRLDEETFWRYNISERPLTDDEDDNWSDYYAIRLDWLITDPNAPDILPPHAPADANNDGAISADELDAAEIIAEDWSYNDVLFDRREAWASWMAEEANQTDGPAYRLYSGFFARVPDFGGLSFWSTRPRTGGTLLGTSEFFVDSDEFIETYGEYDTYGPEDATDAAEFVALVYKNVLDRDPDGSGFSFWTRQLQTERYTPAEVMIGFTESDEFQNTMDRRVTAGSAYAHLLGRMPTQEELALDTLYDHFFVDSPDDFLYNGPGWVSGYERVIDLAEFKTRVG